jgi:hypothetical protein
VIHTCLGTCVVRDADSLIIQYRGTCVRTWALLIDFLFSWYDDSIDLEDTIAKQFIVGISCDFRFRLFFNTDGLVSHAFLTPLEGSVAFCSAIAYIKTAIVSNFFYPASEIS